jgi:hypothetical protein
MIKNLLLSVVSVLLTLTLLEISVRFLEDDGQFQGTYLDLQMEPISKEEQASNYLIEDRKRGWMIRPNAESKPATNPGNYVYQYRSNGDGFRDDRERSRTPEKLRIALFGDSFVHADEVNFEDTWGQILERDLFEGVEVLNFGVPGYGTDQSFLHYRELGKTFHPHIVLIGYQFENIGRNVNLLRKMYYAGSKIPFSKPRFVLNGEDLRLVNYPTTPYDELRKYQGRFGKWPQSRFDYYYNPWVHNDWSSDRVHLLRFIKSRLVESFDVYDRKRDYPVLYTPGSEPYRTSLAVIRTFYEEVKQGGSEPVVMIFPDANYLYLYMDNQRFFMNFLDDLDRLGIRYLDLTQRFSYLRQLYWDPIHIFWAEVGHLTPRANVVAAQQAARYLDRNVIPNMGEVLKTLPPVRLRPFEDLE